MAIQEKAGNLMNSSRLLKPYMWLIVAFGGAVTIFSVWRFPLTQLSLEAVILALIALGIGSRVSIRLPKLKIPGFNSGVSLSDTFVFLSLLLFGGETAILLSVTEAFVSSFRVTKKNLTRAFNAAAMGISTFLTVWVLRYKFGALETLGSNASVAQLIMTICLMALLQYIFNTGLVATGMALRFGAPIWDTWKKYYLGTLIPYLAGAGTAVLTVKLINEIGFYGFLIVAPVLLILYFIYSTYLKDIETSSRNAEAAEQNAAELQESEERFRNAFDNAPIGMALVAADGRWLRVNPALCQIGGYSEEELLEVDFQAITHPSHLGPMMSHLSQILSGQIATFQMENRFFHKLCHEVWVLVGISPSHEGQESEARLMFQIQDITDRKRAEQKLLHEAFHDGLTQLPNRAMFVDHLKLALDRAKRSSQYLFALLFIDLDRFKIINDSLGHALGDQVLIEVAQRLQHCLRPGDTVARLGGDEFTILLEDIKDIKEAILTAERIQHEVSQPCVLNGHDIFTTASIGIALYNSSYQQPDELLRDADTAMYRAKSAGKAQHVIFDSVMHAQVLNRMKMEADLRRGIERDEFHLLYQPIISLPDNCLAGFEALVRWRHPERGLVSPAEFIPLAEETGLIIAIGYWVMQEACRQMKEWQQTYPDSFPLQVSVNLSSRQFSQPNLNEQIKNVLEESALNPRYLKLELTESAVMDNVEAAITQLQELRELGIELSIDDFGTGYSSLSYLHRFPLDTLKIDRSFVMQMCKKENLEIVRTIIALAESLGLAVIAEGIETAEQLLQLQKLNCEYGQGYYFAKPLDKEAAGAFIREGKGLKATCLPLPKADAQTMTTLSSASVK
jgi:diguanylate cyclase (GGDEF)-like protein/PAS domain S-box-containing protein